MRDTERDRLAQLQGGYVPDVDPEIRINNVVLHNASGVDVPLRTKPHVLSLILKVLYCMHTIVQAVRYCAAALFKCSSEVMTLVCVLHQEPFNATSMSGLSKALQGSAKVCPPRPYSCVSVCG